MLVLSVFTVAITWLLHTPDVIIFEKHTMSTVVIIEGVAQTSIKLKWIFASFSVPIYLLFIFLMSYKVINQFNNNFFLKHLFRSSSRLLKLISIASLSHSFFFFLMIFTQACSVKNSLADVHFSLLIFLLLV